MEALSGMTIKKLFSIQSLFPLFSLQRRWRSIALALIVFACCSPLSLATITEVQPLSFGRVAVANNSSVQQVSVSALGNITSSAGIRVITAGSPAIFLLSDFPGNLFINLSASIIQPGTNSGVVSGEQFTLTGLDVASFIATRPDGTATVPVGGTLQTSGSGSVNFADTDYTARLMLTISF